MLFPALVAIVVGAAIIAQWVVTISKGGIVTPKEDRVSGRGRNEMLFHLAAEGTTALTLLAAGVALLLDLAWSLSTGLVAFGMLAYTSINSAGFFAQRGERHFVAVFGVTLALATVSLAIIATSD